MRHRWMATGAIVALTVSCNSEPALLRQMRKMRIIHALRQTVLESAEAEKSAVLATSDEESKALAQEARDSAATINHLRDDLRSLVVADGRRVEIEKLDAFDAAWAEVEHVDQRLLALAVANTNLKAARLSANEGAAHLDRFVDLLKEISSAATTTETIRLLSAASIAALRIQPLVIVHIPSPDDAEMTGLENRMRTLGDEVDRNLASVRDGGQVPADQLADATREWTEYQRVLKDVLRLSRENSNVISFDVSVHEKRHVTKECLAALTALQEVVDVGQKGSR